MIGNVTAHNYININGYNAPWLYDPKLWLWAFHNQNFMVYTLKNLP